MLNWMELNWVIDALKSDDKVAALFDRAPATWEPGNGKRKRVKQVLEACFVKPYAYTSYDFSGDLYGIETAHIAYEVTGNHRVWRKGHTEGCSRWSCMDASEVHGGCHSFMNRANFKLRESDPEWFIVPEVKHSLTGKSMSCQTQFPFKAWVRFMALYLSEGNVRHANKNDHRILHSLHGTGLEEKLRQG